MPSRSYNVSGDSHRNAHVLLMRTFNFVVVMAMRCTSRTTFSCVFIVRVMLQRWKKYVYAYACMHAMGNS